MVVKKKSTKATVSKVDSSLKRHEKDTWSPEAQINLLSHEVELLQAHLVLHPKDVDAKRSLLKKVAKRRRLLKYLKDNNLSVYTQVSKKINLKV